MATGRASRRTNPLSPMHNGNPTERNSMLQTTAWWLRPWWAATAVVVPTIFAAMAIPANDFIATWGTPKYVDMSIVGLTVLELLIVVMSALMAASVGRKLHSSWPVAGEHPGWRKAATKAFVLLAGLTFVGYASWIGLAAFRGIGFSQIALLFSDQSGGAAGLKDTLGTVAGVTTCTQFGLPAAALGTLLYTQNRSKRILATVAAIVVFALLRAFLFSERLALLEVVAVVLAVGAQVLWARGAKSTRRRVSLLPAVAVPLIFVMFTAFEASRSWQYYAAQSNRQDLVTFSAERLEGYYSTAYDNGIIALQHFWPPDHIHVPYFTVGFAWNFPGIKGQAQAISGGEDPTVRWAQLLSFYGNPEFNSPGGISAPIVDFGPAGGVVILAVIGLILGRLYRRFRFGDPLGVLLYPIAFVGVLDLPREFYLGTGRAFPAIVGALIVGAYLTRLQHRLRGVLGTRTPATATVPAAGPVEVSV